MTICAVLVAFACPAHAVNDVLRKRIVHHFDFEEADDGNFEELPMHWWVIGRDPETDDPTFLQYPIHKELIDQTGYPTFTEVRFDRPQREKGKHGFHLGLNGGNVGAFVEVGTIAAVPGSDYMISARLRTVDLKHSGAKLSAYFMDTQGRRVEASVQSVANVRTGGEWQTVSVRLRGDEPKAAWIGLQVEVLQQAVSLESHLGPHQIVYQDVKGAAQFDDISVWQVPRVTVHSRSRTNVIRHPEKPTLSLEVRDMTGNSLVALASLYDHRMQRVASVTQHIDRDDPAAWTWTPPLNRFGWYLVDLSVYESSGETNAFDPLTATVVSQAVSSLLWLDDEKAVGRERDESKRFIVNGLDLPDDQLRLMPLLLKQTGLYATVLSGWSRDTTMASLDERLDLIGGVIEQLREEERRVTVGLFPLPSLIVREHGLDARSPVRMFERPFEVYGSYLAPLLRRYGQRVDRWQLGDPRQAQAFGVGDLAALTESIHQELRSLAPNPRMVMPWRISQAYRSIPLQNSDVVYSIDVTPSVRPEHLIKHVEPYSAGSSRVVLNLRSPDAMELSQQRRVTDMALRLLHAWEAQPMAVALQRPWTWVKHRDVELLPDPLLGVFSSVANRLAGRRVVGWMPIVDGARSMILAPGSGASGNGALAIWNESAEPGDAVLHMYLGESPVLIDVFGNRSDVPLIDGKHRVQLDATPQFIEGIDPKLALFRAGFAIDPSFVESKQTQHARSIMVTNPWNQTMTGTMVISSPEKWRIEPQRHVLSIPAGATVSLPVKVIFPVSTVAGKKQLKARFDIVTDQRRKLIVNAPMEVGLPYVKFDASMTLRKNETSGQLDVVVTQVIRNTGDRILAFYCFANLPGYPRQERIVSNLEPGETVVRRFRFSGAGVTVNRNRIRVGLRETSGPAVLNQLIEAPGKGVGP